MTMNASGKETEDPVLGQGQAKDSMDINTTCIPWEVSHIYSRLRHWLVHQRGLITEQNRKVKKKDLLLYWEAIKAILWIWPNLRYQCLCVWPHTRWQPLPRHYLVLGYFKQCFQGNPFFASIPAGLMSRDQHGSLAGLVYFISSLDKMGKHPEIIKRRSLV